MHSAVDLRRTFRVIYILRLFLGRSSAAMTVTYKAEVATADFGTFTSSCSAGRIVVG
jgi:hypothetical protein